MKIVNIVGARPQFIKCATVSREIRSRSGIEEIILHTGQHYDLNMSEIFFRELEIPEPDVNLGIGSGTHAVQTAEMLQALEKSLFDIQPDWVVVYGDTNSTLAAVVAASKLNLRIAHVEAGLRSFNREMPEEINRIVTDHVADLLFAPTRTAMELLGKEGLASRSVLCGDVMYDSVLHSIGLAEKKYGDSQVRTGTGDPASIPVDGSSSIPSNKKYYLATVHRAENTDHPERLANIFEAFSKMDHPVILPLHPRLKHKIGKIDTGKNFKIIEPVGYLQMLMLLRGSEKVLTDSGGLQKEAFFLEKQCITLREETEWTETLENYWNIIAGTDPEKILESLTASPTGPRRNHFGDGHAARLVVESLLNK